MNKVILPASPIGTFKMAFLDRPSPKYDTFSANLVIKPGALARDGRSIEQVKTWLEGILAEYRAEVIKADPKKKNYGSRLPIEMDVDELGDETGDYVLKAKQGATITRKDGTVINVKVDLFDAKGKRLEGVPVGRGSTGRIGGKVFGYVAESNKQIGLSIYLEAAVILTLTSPGQRDASTYGFGEEDGYEGLGGDDSSSNISAPEESDAGGGDSNF